MIEKVEHYYTCPKCGGLLTDRLLLMPKNGDQVEYYCCEDCNLKFIPDTPYSKFKPYPVKQSARKKSSVTTVKTGKKEG